MNDFSNFSQISLRHRDLKDSLHVATIDIECSVLRLCWSFSKSQISRTLRGFYSILNIDQQFGIIIGQLPPKYAHHDNILTHTLRIFFRPA